MPKLNQMSCVSPVEPKCMVAAPKASLPLDLSLTALLSARGQNVIRNTFLSEGLTSAESPGISEAVQLCKYLPISVRQSHARFHFSALSSYVVLSSISFHLKSMHRVWDNSCGALRYFRRWQFYRVRENQLRESEAPIRTFPYSSISPRYFYTVFNTVWPLTACIPEKHLLLIWKTKKHKNVHITLFWWLIILTAEKKKNVPNFIFIWLQLSAINSCSAFPL